MRKHAGMIVPAPVQAAMAAALGDDAHVAEQRERYARRRAALLAALTSRRASRVDHSEAGLYLWATRDEPCWATLRLARRTRHPRRARATSTARAGARTSASR